MEEFWKSVIDTVSKNTITDGERLRLSWKLASEWEESVKSKNLTPDMKYIKEALIKLDTNKADELLDTFNKFCEVNGLT